MVKKILFLLTFLFITFSFNLDVNAMPLGYPETWAYFNDGSHLGPDSSTIYNWWEQQYYKSPYLMGGVSSAQYINRLDFNFNNANLCSNQDISIDGSIGALFSFFNEQSYSLVVYSNGLPLTCSTNVTQAGSILNFKCYGKGGGSLNFFLYQNSYSLVKQYDVGISRDMTVSCDVSNQEIVNQSITNTQNIINNQNSNTNTITQNQDTNTQNIINNQNQNKQDVINNQNANTDKEIESQKVCKDTIIDNTYPNLSCGYLNASGDVVCNATFSNFKVTDFIDISSINEVKVLEGGASSDRTCFYNSNKQFISCLNRVSPGTLSIPNNTNFVRMTINTVTNAPKFSLNICSNGNQILSDDLNNLNDTLNDTSQPNTNQDINDMNDMVASDTPISDLITMPLTLINAYINGVNSSCSSVNLGNLYGTDLILPCINLEQRLGSNLWNIIDILCCIFLCYEIAMLFISAFDGITSLRDDFEGLYQPKHAYTGYVPKHGGGN